MWEFWDVHVNSRWWPWYYVRSWSPNPIGWEFRHACLRLVLIGGTHSQIISTFVPLCINQQVTEANVGPSGFPTMSQWIGTVTLSIWFIDTGKSPVITTCDSYKTYRKWWDNQPTQLDVTGWPDIWTINSETATKTSCTFELYRYWHSRLQLNSMPMDCFH